METPITNLIEDIIKAVEAKAEAAYPQSLGSATACEVGHLRFLLDEALQVVPRQHLARVAERYGVEIPKPERKPRPLRSLGLRLTR